MTVLEPQLRIPGPTPLPDPIREAGAWQMINHRGPEFAALMGRVVPALQRGFRTANDVLLVGASGTGGLEAAVVNHLSPADPVLAVSIGAFGDRFAKIATRYGAEVRVLPVEWGHAAEPQAVRQAVREMSARGRAPVAVLLTHNETSTGVTNPVAELASAVHEEAPDALLLVDAISGLGAVPFETDAWGLDVVVTGSQKSWMVAPGLTMLAVSARAWAASERASMPRFYFDLRAHRDAATNGATPWTPPVSVCLQLDVALALIEAEGYPAVFARHAACGAATRAGLAALGFRLFADPAHASNTVTAAHVPADLDWKAFNADLRRRGLVVAGGQGKLTGQIFRVGHLGYVSVNQILAALDILEEALLAAGRLPERGASLAAAARAADAAGAVGKTGDPA
ncbi:MAG: pyridoxal-phosphate-dependent aminotransferase family protein [Candidatus Limnocylindrales bacterium]